MREMAHTGTDTQQFRSYFRTREGERCLRENRAQVCGGACSKLERNVWQRIGSRKGILGQKRGV